MSVVQITTEITVPRTVVEEKLSPEAIVRYNEPWTLKSAEERDGKTVLTVFSEQFDDVKLEFTQHSNGYSFRQVSETGPFEEMETKIELAGEEHTAIAITSEFTFGGRFERIKNWLGKTVRREELEQLLRNLVLDAAEDRIEPTET